MKKAFEFSINVLVGLAAVFLIYGFVANRVNRPRLVKAGDRLPALQGVAWGGHDATLLLVMRKGCHFCEQSAPFYRKIIALRDKHQVSTQLIAAFPDAEADARGVLQEEQLGGVGLISGFSLSNINVTGTPTLILADRRGVVSHVWIGALQADGEADVLKALRLSGS